MPTTYLSELDFPVGYRALAMQPHRSAAGALVANASSAGVYLNTFDPSRLQMRDQREPLHLASGGDLGTATKAFRYITLAGMLKHTTAGAFHDLISQVRQVFDIDECIAAYPTTGGLSALTFSTPSAVTGYTPYVPELFYARPAEFPVVIHERSDGLSARFAAVLVCEDPRRYLASATSLSLPVDGSTWAIAAPNWDTSRGVMTPPTLTITMSAAGHASFTVTNGTTSLVLDLSGMIASDVVVVNMATGVITKNGTANAALRTSAVDTYWYVPRGGCTITATNTTGITSIVIAYRQARL